MGAFLPYIIRKNEPRVPFFFNFTEFDFFKSKGFHSQAIILIIK